MAWSVGTAASIQAQGLRHQPRQTGQRGGKAPGAELEGSSGISLLEEGRENLSPILLTL